MPKLLSYTHKFRVRENIAYGNVRSSSIYVLADFVSSPIDFSAP